LFISLIFSLHITIIFAETVRLGTFTIQVFQFVKGHL